MEGNEGYEIKMSFTSNGIEQMDSKYYFRTYTLSLINDADEGSSIIANATANGGNLHSKYG